LFVINFSVPQLLAFRQYCNDLRSPQLHIKLQMFTVTAAVRKNWDAL